MEQQAQPRGQRGRFGSPEEALAAAEELVETGTARHRDDTDRLKHVKAIDARKDRRWRQVQRHLDSIELEVSAIRRLADERDREDVLNDALLNKLEDSQADHVAEHRDAAGILDRQQRGRTRRTRISVELPDGSKIRSNTEEGE